MSDFKVVTYKKYKHKKNHKNVIPDIKENIDEDFNVEYCKTKIEEYKLELKQSSFWTDCEALLHHSLSCVTRNCTYQFKETDQVGNETKLFQEIVVYGIGCISQSHISKYQLAWVLLIIERLKAPCHFYDPVMNEKEVEILKDYGMVNITENEECKRDVTVQTLFIMMHCGKAMYNNLLWKNWNESALEKVFIVGNSFAGYEERVPSRILIESAKYLKEIIPFTVQHNISNSFTHDDIFNDTSIHSFPKSLLSQIPQTLWLDDREPVRNRDDVEIIAKKR